MSRSNPADHLTNPATRWFEWNGEKGVVRYYDKDAKQTVTFESEFSFLLLDELATVRGWHEESESGIYANEVRDTRKDPLIVKSFKAGTLIEGLYADIKDRVHTLGGKFVANCYIAFKNGGDGLALGAVQFKGAALRAWMDFRRSHRSELYRQAVRIVGTEEGKKGRVTFRVPVFQMRDVSKETDTAAKALDLELQAYFKAYFARATREQADHAPAPEPESYQEPTDVDSAAPLTDDDIPF